MSILKRNIPGRNLIKAIIEFSPIKSITQSFVFIYEGQKPNVALFIKKGQVLIGSKKINISSSETGKLLFFDELVKGSTLKNNVEVLRGSEVSIIDKQTAQKIIDFTCLKERKL